MVKELSNINYWERILKNPRKSYIELFEQEKKFLQSRVKKGSRFLDVGCGNGRVISYVKNSAAEIVGIDFDEAAVKYSSKRFAANKKIKIFWGSAFDIPFKDNLFDYVSLMLTLVNFSNNKLKALSEMKRVMKREGSILLSVYSDSAFDERLKMYNEINAPIKRITGTTFCFNFYSGETLSEQFSLPRLQKLCAKAGLRIVAYVLTDIGLICEIKNKQIRSKFRKKI